MNNMFEINHNDEQAYDLNNFNDNNNSNTPNRNSFHVADQQVSNLVVVPPQYDVNTVSNCTEKIVRVKNTGYSAHKLSDICLKKIYLIFWKCIQHFN